METHITSNTSSYAKDLLATFPRFASAFFQVPEAFGDIRDMLLNGGSIIADATGHKSVGMANTTNTTTLLARTAAPILSTATLSWSEGGADAASSIFGVLLQTISKLKNIGGVFSYLTSRWALATFTAAIILNRVQFYASSRQPLRPKWHVRLAIYLIPILAFISQMHIILQALRCQTSPDYAQIRYEDPQKVIPLDFAGEGGFLYRLSSLLLFWEDDAACCTARQMSITALNGDALALRGSMSLLFWFFLTLCTSQLFETLLCALQGRQPVPETGLTIFEHSLAFAECETMISSTLGLGVFGLPKLDEIGQAASTDGVSILLTRGEVMQRLNVPPEVLLVCFISCLSHLSSAILATTGIRERVRLVNTGVWACCYMSAFLWNFFRIFSRPIQTVTDLSVLRFPTVCIIGFIPHVFILIGILMCSIIYGSALLLTAASIPEDLVRGMSFVDRLKWAFDNLQANVQFLHSSAIHIRMSEDFYTTILKVGFSVLTAASEAVYLNEGMRIQIAQSTWLERRRLDELAQSIAKHRQQQTPIVPMGDEIARGVEFVDHANGQSTKSPYARERRSKPKVGNADRADALELDNGLGVSHRRSRMHLTFRFVSGIFWLVISIYAQVAMAILRKLGFVDSPNWLLRAAGSLDSTSKDIAQNETDQVTSAQDFYVLENDRLVKADDEQIDVEVELRRRNVRFGEQQTEDQLGERIYQWWARGGWFGESDASGDFQPHDIDEDATSVMTQSTDAESSDAWSDDGQRTPTQAHPAFSREPTPISDFGSDLHHLSRLLDPQTLGQREEARLLSYSLQSQKTMTRSEFRRVINEQRAKVLRSLDPAIAAEDEERDLEHYILQQRARAKTSRAGSTSWQSGADGMGEGGPQCVVCQSTPRTILVWPCGCLSMCDDCRVGLAARNYTKCICCRTDIAAYSRLYVP